MKCMQCHGKLERGTSSYRVDREGYHLTLMDLPSWVCQQCGLALYDDEQSDTIERVIQTLDAAAQKLRHPART